MFPHHKDQDKMGGVESVFPLHKDQGQTSERKEGRTRQFLVSQVEFRFYSQSMGEY